MNDATFDVLQALGALEQTQFTRRFSSREIIGQMTPAITDYRIFWSVPRRLGMLRRTGYVELFVPTIWGLTDQGRELLGMPTVA